MADTSRTDPPDRPPVGSHVFVRAEVSSVYAADLGAVFVNIPNATGQITGAWVRVNRLIPDPFNDDDAPPVVRRHPGALVRQQEVDRLRREAAPCPTCRQPWAHHREGTACEAPRPDASDPAPGPPPDRSAETIWDRLARSGGPEVFFPEAFPDDAPDEDDLAFARETLGVSATEDDVRHLASQRAVTAASERSAAFCRCSWDATSDPPTRDVSACPTHRGLVADA